MIKTQVATLLEKEMDRREFLRHVGIAVAVVVGLPTFLNVVSRLQSGSLRQDSAQGYGNMPYGGNRER